MPQARQVVGHEIERAREVVGFGQVAEVALVETVEAKQVGGGT
jgi:hypothetical protein